jgi:hypothetical protein
MKSTHSDRLERWLGVEQVAGVSRAMRDFYWPIAMHGVPGVVHAMPGGDFTGEIRAGQEMSALDRASDIVRRMRRAQRARMAMSRRQLGAFSNLSALIAAATGGKAQSFNFTEVGTAVAAAGNAADLWTNPSGMPASGAAGSAAPGGKAWTNSDVGTLPFANPANSNTAHFVTGYASASVVANTLLLYDRLFSVAKTMNSTATEAVTGTFARYQSATATANNYVGGNFCFPSNPTTILPATGHNWTVCQYTNQAGATTKSFPSIAGLSACAVHAIDLPAGFWFMPLASGDVGVKALSQMQCSALVATGTIDFVVGHAIAFLPCPIANMVCVVDGINTAFSLVSVFDNAALAFLELPKPATTATTYSGSITVVSE